MKLFTPIIVMTSFMISCADILIEDTSNTTSTSGIVGFWFSCEFNSSDTDCRFFDDDGYQFTDDGSVYSVEAILFEPDPGCGSYTCFDSFKPSIFITRQLLGSYNYIDSSLTLNPESDTSCVENFNWNNEVSFFRDSLSLCPSLSRLELYVQKYTGEVIIY